MKVRPLRCVLCGKVAVLGQWFVVIDTGPAHKACAAKLGGSQVVSAIYANRPIITTNVTVKTGRGVS